MKNLASKTLFAAAALAASPALAADPLGGTNVNALFPQLSVTEPSLTDVATITNAGTGLFSQISTSIASPTVAIMTPAFIEGGNVLQENVPFIDGSGSYYFVEASIDPFDPEIVVYGASLYYAPGEQPTLYFDKASCQAFFSGCEPIATTYDSIDYQIHWVEAGSTTTSASNLIPSGLTPVTLTGVDSLANLSAAAYNSLTLGALPQYDPILGTPTIASQVALTYGSGSIADMTLPIVLDGHLGVTISNTALGAVNTINAINTHLQPY